MKRRPRKKDYEIKFYEGLLKKRPDFTQALSSLGDAYTRRGFYEEGLDVDKRLVALKPEDPIAHYNLACSLSLTNDISQAQSELKKAVFVGYNDLAYILEDADMENLRNAGDFCAFFHELKNFNRQKNGKL
jgi:tetratricopeptide (TPR) repeat protein